MKKSRGITLIALVITIVVMLILVGVTIGTLTSSGLFNSAKSTASNFKKEVNTESTLSKVGNKTVEELAQ